jgi:hypothetical protein
VHRLISDIIERIGRHKLSRIGPIAKTELQRFRDQWPAVAAMIGIPADEPPPGRPFDPGVVWFEHEHQGVSFSEQSAREWLARHYQLAKVENGWASSRFELDQADQERWPRPQFCQGHLGPRPVRYLTVLTRVGSETVMSIVAENAREAPAVVTPPETRRMPVQRNPFGGAPLVGSRR